MHRRAFYVPALLILALRGCQCEDKSRWYSGLQGILTNCPYNSWNTSGQAEFLEKFRGCLQERTLRVLDDLLNDDVIPVFDGLDLVRFREDEANVTENHRMGGDEESWTTLILNRLARVLRSHVFKVDVDHLSSGILNHPRADAAGDETLPRGRRRRHRKRHSHMMPLMMMGFMLMGSILIPMGFQFLAVLGGKALLLAKMALILSSIQGLKKIATNGVNYGLYHSPSAEGWHDRSQLPPAEDADLNYKTYLLGRP